MMALELQHRRGAAHLGLKGPRGAEWLTAHGLALPMAANTWSEFNSVVVARLGSTEFFLEDNAGGGTVDRLRGALAAGPTGVYPVLREDWSFVLRGTGVHDVLAQVCNINFADVPLQSHSVVMTLMVGVSVLVLPEGEAAQRAYRIWCDPTFGPYLGEALSAVVNECGGNYKGATA